MPPPPPGTDHAWSPCTIWPADGSDSTRTASAHSTCPTTATVTGASVGSPPCRTRCPSTPSTAIPLAEVELRTSRSSGPGGQHANVTASRVEAIFDASSSPSLSESQRRRVIARAGARVTAVAQDTRSQARNRELALERLQSRLAAALRRQRPRRNTRPTRASKERRLEGKRQRSNTKRARKRPDADSRR